MESAVLVLGLEDSAVEIMIRNNNTRIPINICGTDDTDIYLAPGRLYGFMTPSKYPLYKPKYGVGRDRFLTLLLLLLQFHLGWVRYSYMSVCVCVCWCWFRIKGIAVRKKNQYSNMIIICYRAQKSLKSQRLSIRSAQRLTRKNENLNEFSFLYFVIFRGKTVRTFYHSSGKNEHEFVLNIKI